MTLSDGFEPLRTEEKEESVGDEVGPCVYLCLNRPD